MFNWIKNLTGNFRIDTIPLYFDINLNKEGKQVIKVSAEVGGKKEKINNVEQLWDYGNELVLNGKKYVISMKSLETLFSIRSLNPQIDHNNDLVFDVCPPILQFLRKSKNVKESEYSKNKIKVSDKVLKPIAKIDFNKNKGLTIDTGYSTGKNKKEIIKESNIEMTSDGYYAKMQDTYYQLPQEIDSEVKEWLHTEHKEISIDDIPEFFKKDLILLKSKMKAVLSQEANSVEVIKTSFSPNVKIYSDNDGWLNFKIDYIIGDFSLPFDLLVNNNKDYIVTKDNKFVQFDKNTIDDTKKYLDNLNAEKTDEGFRVPVSRFFSIEDFIEKIGGHKEISNDFSRFLDKMTDFHANEEFKLFYQIEEDLKNEDIRLRPYQRAGIHWLTWLMTHHLHGILADDMGLGKTIQTIVTMRHCWKKENIERHSLIICPKSVVHFWKREINRVFPQAKICEYIGTYRKKSLWRKTTPRIFITTYATAAIDVNIIQNIPLYFVVLDEATKIKNPKAKRTLAVKSFNSLHRIILTGTPIENRPSELWSLFDFLMKGHLGNYNKFVNTFENPITNGDDYKANLLSNRIRPFILRRLKKDVAKDLPEKIEMDEWCELTNEQKSLYGQIQDIYASPVRDSLKRGEHVNYPMSILPVLVKLKQICNHPALITGTNNQLYGRSEKFDLIIEKVGEIISNNERVVLFSQYLGTLDLFQEAFDEKSINFVRLDGSTNNRQKIIDKFNSGKVEVALCSIKACGHGITLTAANHVFHIDLWWNPAVLDQATDRVHRIGQDKNVYVYKILNSNTLEEKIENLLEKKRNISDRVIGSATNREMKWTRKELLELLKPLE